MLPSPAGQPMLKIRKFSLRMTPHKNNEIGRAHCCDKANVERGPWSIEEDSKLKEYIEKYGTEENWIALPQKAGLKRCRKSCILEWLNQFLALQCHGQAFWLESCVRELESDEAFESCSLAIDNNNNLPIPIN